MCEEQIEFMSEEEEEILRNKKIEATGVDYTDEEFQAIAEWIDEVMLGSTLASLALEGHLYLDWIEKTNQVVVGSTKSGKIAYEAMKSLDGTEPN